MRPLLFIIYVSPVGDLIKSHGVSHHQYADDTQQFLAIKASSISANLAKPEFCFQAVKRWFTVNNLMLNADISDVMLLGHQSSCEPQIIFHRLWLPART